MSAQRWTPPDFALGQEGWGHMLGVTRGLRIVWEATLAWLEEQHHGDPESADQARDLSVCYERLGDVYWAQGESARALEYYRQGLEIRERLVQAEPHRADLAWDLAVSCIRMGRMTLPETS